MKIRFVLLLLFVLYGVSVSPCRAAPSAITGHWEGTAVREGKAWRIWIDISANGDGFKGTIDAPDYGLYALPLTAITFDGTQVNLAHTDRSGTVKLNGVLDGDRISGQWDGLGVIATLQLKRTSSVPVTVAEEEIHFQRGEAVLAGTLIKPTGSGRFPAVVFTHGSGNQTRTEDFYRSRAYLFARHGMAALIYDRRGKGASTGEIGNVGFTVLADDAIAGVQSLMLRADIDPKRIGVAGFSQGGYVTPVAATHSRDVAFVMVGSAPGITPEEQNDFGIENELRAKQIPESTIAAVMSLRQRFFVFQTTGIGDVPGLESEIKRLQGETWFKNTSLPDGPIEPMSQGAKGFLAFDPATVWEKVRVPVLGMWGASDELVPAQKSRTVFARALAKAGNRDVTLRIFPSAGHGLGLVQPKDAGWDWPRLAPGYQELMVKWTLRQINEINRRTNLERHPKRRKKSAIH